MSLLFAAVTCLTSSNTDEAMKSYLNSAFASLPDATPFGSHIIHIVDGSYLLHKVV